MNEKLIEEYNNLQILEPISLDDSKKKSIRGLVIFKDNSGNIIDIKENLILFETRKYILESLFETSDDKKICLFKIGQGGADVNGSPFNPYVPRFSDTDLAEPIPFKIVDVNKDATYESRSNTSIVTELSTEDKSKLFLSTTDEDLTTKYYGKVFDDSSTGWKIDESTGEVAYSLNLTIEADEARGYKLNELGLILANKSGDDYINPTLASRVTFSTKSLQDLNETINIEYIIYC